MERDKSRGLKHIANKQKYKGNSTKNPKCIPSKSKTDLRSNWDRYEMKDGDQKENGILTDAADFSVLASAPLSLGKHFQFRNDRHVADEIKTDSINGLFHLDLVKLEESISSIPFYERVTIDKSMFSKQQIEIMKAEAEESTGRNENQEELSNCDSSLSDDDILSEISVHSNNLIEETNKSSIVVPKSVDDLEEWLEDILNE